MERYQCLRHQDIHSSFVSYEFQFIKQLYTNIGQLQLYPCTPFFGQYIGRNKFQDILWNLHVCNTKTTKLLVPKITTLLQSVTIYLKCVNIISIYVTHLALLFRWMNLRWHLGEGKVIFLVINTNLSPKYTHC